MSLPNPYFNPIGNTPSLPTMNSVPIQSDIQIPKQNIQQSLGLRQIKDFNVVDNFTDSFGKTWKLVKRSTDSSIEIPDPQYLQVTDYWNHEFPGTSPKSYIYVVEGIKHPRDNEENAQKAYILYQWFSTTYVQNFTPQMISQQEWHRANVYSCDFSDTRVSKLIALCKLKQNAQNEPVPVKENEYIEDISLEGLTNG